MDYDEVGVWVVVGGGYAVCIVDYDEVGGLKIDNTTSPHLTPPNATMCRHATMCATTQRHHVPYSSRR